MTNVPHEEIAEHLRPAFTRLPDGLPTERVELFCRLYSSVTGRPQDSDPRFASELWLEVARSLSDVEDEGRLLVIESLRMAENSWGMIALRDIRSTSADEMLDRTRRLELPPKLRYGRVAVLKSFGEPREPVKRVRTTGPSHYL